LLRCRSPSGWTEPVILDDTALQRLLGPIRKTA
jgi:hypothetical protein